MNPAYPSTERSVSRLFQMLEQSGIRYAVLRNYELLPALRYKPESALQTDIDLVIHTEDLPLWRAIAITLAAEHKWDAATECDHWMQSKIRAHNIEVFRFYRVFPAAFLQVDVFHGYLVWGFPLFEEGELLEGRIRSSNRQITHIDPLKENTFRLLQINGLLASRHSKEKIRRYRNKVLHFCGSENKRMHSCLRNYFSVFGERAVTALKAEKFDRFALNMRFAKAYFAVRFVVRRPFQSIEYSIARFKDHRKRYFSRQCGSTIRIFAPDDQCKNRLRAAMESLVELNVIDRWTERGAGATSVDWHEHKVMEQGGLAVKWANRDSAQFDITRYRQECAIAADIMSFLAGRHPRLELSARDPLSPVYAHGSTARNLSRKRE